MCTMFRFEDQSIVRPIR